MQLQRYAWHHASTLVVLTLSFACTSRSPAPSAAADSVLLRVEPEGKDLRITWDRNAPPLRASGEATLLIDDGNLPRRYLRLSAEELRGGSLLYTPASKEVRVHLALSVARVSTGPASSAAPDNAERSRATPAPPSEIVTAGYFDDAGKPSLTAIHPTLPVGFRARLTNLNNGRSTLVTIRRGGSARPDRSLHVSSSVARELSFERAGAARLRIEPQARP